MRDFLFLKDNARSIRVFFHALQYVEATGKYLRFVTAEKIHVVPGRLQHVIRRLPGDQFCRIHKSFIVSFAHITEFSSATALLGKAELPIGKQYRDTFYRQARVLDASRGDGTVYTPKPGQRS